MNTPEDPDRGTSDGADCESTRRDAAPGETESSDVHPLEPLLAQMAELREFALNYVEARKDKLKASGRRLAVGLALLCVAGVVAVSLLATSMVLILNGLSQLVGDALGGRSGIGQLVVGSINLLAVLAVGKVLVTVRSWKAYRETKQKYERRHHTQRTRFGEDVAERSSS